MSSTGYPPVTSHPTQMPHPIHPGQPQPDDTRFKKKWPLEVGDLFMIRQDARKRTMNLLHTKLQQEKTDMKILPLKDYSPETEQVRCKNREFFSELRSVYNQLNPQIESNLKRYNTKLGERTRRAEQEGQDVLGMNEMQKLAHADAVMVDKLRHGQSLLTK